MNSTVTGWHDRPASPTHRMLFRFNINRITGGFGIALFRLSASEFHGSLTIANNVLKATTKVTCGAALRDYDATMHLVYNLRLPKVDVPWIRTSHGDFLHQNHYSQFWILSYSAFDPIYHFTPLQLAAILYLAILIVTLVFRARAPCPCWRCNL